MGLVWGEGGGVHVHVHVHVHGGRWSPGSRPPATAGETYFAPVWRTGRDRAPPPHVGRTLAGTGRGPGGSAPPMTMMVDGFFIAHRVMPAARPKSEYSTFSPHTKPRHTSHTRPPPLNRGGTSPKPRGGQGAPVRGTRKRQDPAGRDPARNKPRPAPVRAISPLPTGQSLHESRRIGSANRMSSWPAQAWRARARRGGARGPPPGARGAVQRRCRAGGPGAALLLQDVPPPPPARGGAPPAPPRQGGPAGGGAGGCGRGRRPGRRRSSWTTTRC